MKTVPRHATQHASQHASQRVPPAESVAALAPGRPRAADTHRVSRGGARARPPAWRAPIATALSVLIGLLAWEVAGRWLVSNPILFAPFSRVLAAGFSQWQQGRLAHDVAISLLEFALGFTLASVLGVAGGLALGLSRGTRLIFEPWAKILYASPLVALMPFFILVFGIGIASKVAIVATVAVMPILFNTASGVRSVDSAWHDVAHAFECSRLQTLVHVVLPAALPTILVGMRLAVGRGLTGVAVGELFAAQAGLGYLITTAGQSFDTPTLLFGVACFSVLGVLLMAALDALERVARRGREPAGEMR
ncbi:ABC transporter permease [Chitinasiproducens palmae]|uniref:NitT/TauT family transport system permease protein n=1 Tax=Chitinasiproducens palmae TaxID=1770053 RepID=A0A1H2PR82_9BURK|nr:ABC transporter permease [Chitinasiproducens palmae]SDV48961.1 NitT/TauT family transport system permease protein [Chitinasiproducens palmae]